MRRWNLIACSVAIVLGGCGGGADSEPTPTATTAARPTAPLVLGPGKPNTLAGGVPQGGGVISPVIWVTNAGTVRQRAGAAASEVVPNLSDVVSVAIGYAVTRAGALYRWDPYQAPLTATKILDGVADVTTDYGAFALQTDGRVIDLATSQPLPDVANVVAMRIAGFEQSIISGGGQYSRASRYFLQRDGSVLLQDVVVYLGGQLPNTLETTVYARGVQDVTSGGFVQAPNGLIYFDEALVHDVPAKKMASTPRVANQSNSSTLTTSRSTFVLFDDGALWRTTLGSTTGENQQGAPTFSAGVSQFPVRAPGDVDILDFFVLSGEVVIVTRDGASFVSAGEGTTFSPVVFEDLRVSPAR